jgi:hypothetical protein
MVWSRWLPVIGWLLFTASSCYSFKDASVDPNLKTVKVGFFENRATTVNPELSQLFTEGLKDKIVSETNLDLVDAGPDVEFKGTISKYDINPTASQGAESAALNRLTVAVNVEYSNRLDETKNWKSTFTQHADFSRSANFADVEDELVTEINKLLIEEIFSKAFVNW